MRRDTILIVLAVVLLAGFVYEKLNASALKVEAEAARDSALAFEAHGDSLQVIADSLLAVNVELAEETEAQKALTDSIQADADREIERARQEASRARVARIASAQNFRDILPVQFLPQFDEHEKLHAAELTASEHEIEQVKIQLTAAQAFNATLLTELVAVKQARDQYKTGWESEVIQSALWKESSDKFETALEGRGFLLDLLGDLPQIVVAVAVGVAVGATL